MSSTLSGTPRDAPATAISGSCNAGLRGRSMALVLKFTGIQGYIVNGMRWQTAQAAVID